MTTARLSRETFNGLVDKWGQQRPIKLQTDKGTVSGLIKNIQLESGSGNTYNVLMGDGSKVFVRVMASKHPALRNPGLLSQCVCDEEDCQCDCQGDPQTCSCEMLTGLCDCEDPQCQCSCDGNPEICECQMSWAQNPCGTCPPPPEAEEYHHYRSNPDVEDRIQLESGEFGWDYLVRLVGTDKTILIQSDYEYPPFATAFGWRPKFRRDCRHPHTDGTVDCTECGTKAGDFIAEAAAYLDEHIGDQAEDPGYFGDDDEDFDDFEDDDFDDEDDSDDETDDFEDDDEDDLEVDDEDFSSDDEGSAGY